MNLFPEMNIDMGNNKINIIDTNTTVSDFLNLYYGNITTNGWNSSLYLFKDSQSTMLKTSYLNNEYELLTMFTNSYVRRCNIDRLSIKWVQIDNNTILINVFGLIQFVSFFNTYSYVYNFTESFVIKINNEGKPYCHSHILDF